MFHVCMLSLKFKDNPAEMLKKFMRRVKEACNMSMKRRKPGKYKDEVYWWNDEIANLRKDCIKARKRFSP